MLSVSFILKDAMVYNSVYKKFLKNSIAVKDDKIFYVGNDEINKLSSKEIINCQGKWIIPGLIDIHLHIESSMVTPKSFSKAIIKNGITSCVAEAHEIANVFGKSGVEYFMNVSSDCKADIFYASPSSVPSTRFETTGGVITIEDSIELIKSQKLKCLGEVMDCYSILNDENSRTLNFITELNGNIPDLIIEGHCPKFVGLELAQILYAGVNSDHTIQTPETIKARAEAGMFLEIQEKSITKENIDFLNENQFSEYFCFVTDDVMADDFKNGHLRKIIKKAVEYGMTIEDAIYASTKTPANRMNLRDRGFIAPGKLADLVIIDDINTLSVGIVYKNGKIEYSKNDVSEEISNKKEFPDEYYKSVHLDLLKESDFDFFVDADKAKCRVMEINSLSTFTNEIEKTIKVVDKKLDYENTEDVCLVKVFERHKNTGNQGIGFISGTCIKNGAVATTYAHDHHNLLVVGKNKEDMMIASNMVIENNGGICVVNNKEVMGFVDLPVAGIISEEPVEIVGEKLRKVTQALETLGWDNLNPIMSLCTISLPVSPMLKITDLGLIDVKNGKVVDVIKEAHRN